MRHVGDWPRDARGLEHYPGKEVPVFHERTTTAGEEKELEDSLDSQTLTLRWIAGLLIAGAAWLLAPILVPFVVALSLAIALSPLADRLERLGLGRTVSSLACLGLVAGVLVATACLLAYQAGSILQQSDRYLDRLSRVLASTTSAVGGERLLTSLGAIKSESERRSSRFEEPPQRGYDTQ